MKKNDLIKVAVIALAAGFCISGQVAHTGNQELAMTKCTKTTKPANDDGMNGNGTDSDDQSDDNTSKLDRQRAKASSMKGKSAARKVLEGVGPSNTTMNNQRKSAAKKSMEIENQ